EDCKSKLNSNIDERGHFWGEPMLGAATLYASHIDKNDSDARKIVTDYLSSKATGDSYAVLNSWGSARHNTLLQTVALSATKNFDDIDYTEWCANQMGMILGNNTKNICLVVGFADNSAKSPHHRAASNFVRTDPEWKDYNGWSGKYSDVEGSHILVGALCGGPSSSDFNTYNDNAKDATSNEVTIDYNAGLVGAAAGLYYFTGKGTTDTFDEINAASGNELKNVYNETPVNVKVYKNIEVNENETLVLKTGDEGKLVLENPENKTVEWIDSVDSVVKVENGILTVLDEGTAIITAKINDVNKTFNINVQIASVIPDVSEMEHIQDITEFNKNTDNKWTANVNNLPIYSPNGQKYYYYIKENYTGADGRTVAGKNGTYYSVGYTNGVELVNSATVKADVTNEKVETGGATMPSAGGNGTRNYCFAGAFIIGIAGAFWIIRRRKFTE
ncbi:MAG: glycoside hydrolase family 9 protein, partial [Ruminococcus sp.]|nr:glycoside hydrolase family 9 protein [Ruminococcus sp.]